MTKNILQYNGTALEELNISNEGIKESLQKLYDGIPTNINETLSQILPNVKSVFSSLKDKLDFSSVEVDKTLSKDQKQFLDIVSKIPYAEIRELKAFRPEGLKVTYLELLDVLEEEVNYCSTIQDTILKPYIKLLGALVSHPDSYKSVETNDSSNKKISDRREKAIDKFSKLYSDDSFSSITTVKYVIGRNNDWEELLNRLNKTLNILEKIDRDSLQKDISICETYIDNIIENVTANEDSEVKVTPEVIRKITNSTLEAAKEIEYLSLTYFRTLTLKGSVENTVEKIKSIYNN